MSHRSRVLFLLASSLLLGALASPAAAQFCDVRNRFRIANSYSGSTSELNVDTGWQGTAPLTTPGSNANPGPTCSSQGSCTPTSDFGWLRCAGSGSANNCASSGTFLVLDQGPQAQFNDTMTVVSGTLPNGTPVQVRFVLSLAGAATMIDSSPSVAYGAALSASSLSLALNAPGVAVGTLNTSVGATMLVHGELGVALYAQGLLGLGVPPSYASYAVDLTARAGIACLTPGASLTFCSGRTYPTLAAEVQDAGGGCGAGSPQLAATLPLLGQTQTFTLANAVPGQPVFFGISFGAAAAIPVGACTVIVDPTGLLLLGAGVADGAGSNQFALALPNAPELLALQYTAQDLVLVPSGPLLGLGALSNGVRSTVGP